MQLRCLGFGWWKTPVPGVTAGWWKAGSNLCNSSIRGFADQVASRPSPGTRLLTEGLSPSLRADARSTPDGA
ncbi:hypothetical protein VZT92_020757 [Zoarces viviparus]|uniref:Uncharacterized protein n=1 Tax=Zoarces viviparus TaxID=48416 RepID=A0AAW1EGV6_ZOAVI